MYVDVGDLELLSTGLDCIIDDRIELIGIDEDITELEVLIEDARIELLDTDEYPGGDCAEEL